MTNVPVKTEKGPTSISPATVPSWDKFRDEMERLFDRFSTALDFPALKPIHEIGNFWPSTVTGLAGMAVDVSEDDKSYKITAELPGLDEKNVEVTVSDDSIVLKGEKSDEKEEKGKNRYYSERSYGVFRRSFALPKDADRKAIDAKFSKGVLTVSIPKTLSAQKVEKIQVKAA
jgi:HSP20 family protein